VYYLHRIQNNVKGTTDHELKLEKPRYIKDSRKFFLHRVVRRWNSLDQEIVDATGVNAFEGILHCESKKLCHFYFYCNFGKCWSIF